jgi:hypothetical protein
MMNIITNLTVFNIIWLILLIIIKIENLNIKTYVYIVIDTWINQIILMILMIL